MKKLLMNWALCAMALYGLSFLFNGIHLSGFGAAMAASLVLGLINATIKPVFFILSLPLTILTFGLFTLVINASMLSLASALVPGFAISGFGTAFLAAIVLSVISMLFFGKNKNKCKKHRAEYMSN